MTHVSVHAFFSVTQKTRIAPALFQDLQTSVMLLAFEKQITHL